MRNSLKKTMLILFAHFGILHFSYSQLTFYDVKTEKEYEISKRTDKEIINKYLESINAEAIEFNSNPNSSIKYRIKNKKGIWQINDANDVEEVYNSDKYSLHFPTPIMEELGFTTASKNNKKYIFTFETREVLLEVPFEEIKIHSILDTISNLEEHSEEYEVKARLSYIALQRNQHWALAYYSEDDFQIYQLTNFKYQNEKDLIESNIYQSYLKKHPPTYTKDTEILSFIHKELLKHKSQNTSVEYVMLSKYPLRIKDKKGKWKFYEPENYSSLLSRSQRKKYNLVNSSKAIDELDMGIVERKNKKYLITFQEGNMIFEDTWFDDIEIVSKIDTFYTDFPLLTHDGMDSLDINGDYVLYKEIYTQLEKIILRRDKKYALAFIDNEVNTLYQLSGFHFDAIKNTPNFDHFRWFDERSHEIIYKYEVMSAANNILKGTSNIDLVVPLTYSELNDSHVFKIRNYDTKRWSILMEDGFQSDQTLPIAASKIEYLNLGDPIYVVWCDDKVGFYNETFQHFKACIYDDFQHLNLDYTYGCALKKDGKWELFDAKTTKQLISGKAKSIDELMEMWWNR